MLAFTLVPGGPETYQIGPPIAASRGLKRRTLEAFMNPIYQYWFMRSLLESRGAPADAYVDVDYDPAHHDERVLKLINEYIDKCSSSSNSITDNLGSAVTAIVTDRTKSHDLVDMPDVSYYLQARYEISKDRSPAMQLIYAQGGIALTYFYNVLKVPFVPAQRHLHFHTLETDKGTPNSRASLSSARWVKRGAFDGYNDYGPEIGKPPMRASWPRDFVFGC